ncbi:MAG: triose-phosphate isomerase [Thermoplasmata archaeon]|nr:triose-phosphate isomerase [Thermoplasmata archaeon]
MPSARDPAGRGPPSPTELAPLGERLFLLNLKSYPACLGDAALELGRLLEEAAASAGVPAAIAPAAPDLGRLASELTIPVLAQHVDPFDPGARTGYVVPEAVLAAGGRGSLLNHSEHRLAPPEVAEATTRLHAIGLAVVVCAQDVDDARLLAGVHPAYLAVEPPELIGGDRSVSMARPEVISGSVAAVRSVAPATRVLCGAGVHSSEDVRRALELGSHGVLVASAVTRSSDPALALSELLSGFS